ncbi:MAG: hypothetical protein QW775_08040 [Ignisphaera sp.]
MPLGSFDATYRNAKIKHGKTFMDRNNGINPNEVGSVISNIKINWSSLFLGIPAFILSKINVKIM